MTIKLFAIVLSVFGIASCTPFHLTGSIPPAERGSVGYAVVDAKQRFVLVTDRGGDKPVYCAEPSPDALTAVAAAFGAGLAVPGQAQGEIAVGFNEAAQELGRRTVTIQLLRDSLYRACEAFANGAIDEFAYAQTINNFDRVMIDLLSIESLLAPATSNSGSIKADPINTENLAKILKSIEGITAPADTKPNGNAEGATGDGAKGEGGGGVDDVPPAAEGKKDATANAVELDQTHDADPTDQPLLQKINTQQTPATGDDLLQLLVDRSATGDVILAQTADATPATGEGKKTPKKTDSATSDAEQNDGAVKKGTEQTATAAVIRVELAKAVADPLFRHLKRLGSQPRLIASCMSHYAFLEKQEIEHGHRLYDKDGYAGVMRDYCNAAKETYEKLIDASIKGAALESKQLEADALQELVRRVEESETAQKLVKLVNETRSSNAGEVPSSAGAKKIAKGHPCVQLTPVEQGFLKTREDCELIQKKLCLEADADFGRMTRIKIAFWQQENGDTNPDGHLKFIDEVNNIKQRNDQPC